MSIPSFRDYYDQSYPPDVINPPPPQVPATGATAGIPGTWTPAGANVIPASSSEATSMGIVASPATAWTTGQYVQGSIAGAPGRMTWSGTGWVGGVAP